MLVYLVDSASFLNILLIHLFLTLIFNLSVHKITNTTGHLKELKTRSVIHEKRLNLSGNKEKEDLRGKSRGEFILLLNVINFYGKLKRAISYVSHSLFQSVTVHPQINTPKHLICVCLWGQSAITILNDYIGGAQKLFLLLWYV